MTRIIHPLGGWLRRPLWALLLLAVLGWGCGGAEAPPEAASQEAEAEPTEAEAQQAERPQVPEGPPVDGFKQYMPRGGIPGLFDPQFVMVAEAEIPDDAWVLGFAHQGRAYAYDINTLNRHEVVNHEIEGTPVAAVW